MASSSGLWHERKVKVIGEHSRWQLGRNNRRQAEQNEHSIIGGILFRMKKQQHRSSFKTLQTDGGGHGFMRKLSLHSSQAVQGQALIL